MTTVTQASDRGTLFESVVCGRCGGTGQYSYCSMYGSRCFGCGGRGRKLTRRGQVAQEFYRGLLSRRADELAVGDRVFVLGNGITHGNAWLTVGEAEIGDDGRVRIRFDRESGEAVVTMVGETRDRLYRAAASREERAAAAERAKLVQGALTKQGKVKVKLTDAERAECAAAGLIGEEEHWSARLDEQERIQRDYPDSPVAPEWFDPAYAGERWEEE